MRILFIITGLGMGGAEVQVCNLADKFAQQGHKVLLVSLTGMIIKRPSCHDVEVVSYSARKNISSLIFSYVQCAKLIVDFKPDVVHSHMVHANIFARMLCLSCPIPYLVCTAHSVNEGGFLRMLAYRVTDFLGDVFTNVSAEAVSVFVRKYAVPNKKAIVQANGIDIDLFVFDPILRSSMRHELMLEDNRVLILAVGSLNEAKDYPNLLHAIANLANSDILLAIVGVGSLEAQLKKIVVDLGLSSQVCFLGLRRDIPALMCAADIFILSSAWEGLPTVVGEAMACECITISTDAGGSREWFSPELSHLVVPIRNASALSSKINEVLDLPSNKLDELRKIGRKNIEDKYSLSAIAEQWLNIYKG